MVISDSNASQAFVEPAEPAIPLKKIKNAIIIYPPKPASSLKIL